MLSGPGTTITGHAARRMTRSVTDPKRKKSSWLRPCLRMTIRSTPLAAANCRIAVWLLPRAISVRIFALLATLAASLASYARANFFICTVESTAGMPP